MNPNDCDSWLDFEQAKQTRNQLNQMIPVIDIPHYMADTMLDIMCLPVTFNCPESEIC